MGKGFAEILLTAKPIIELTYIDRLSVSRNVQEPHPDNPNVTRNVERPVEELQMVHCKWNPTEQLMRQDSPANIGLYDINDINAQFMVYTFPNLDIRKGDHIFIYKVDSEENILVAYDGLASLPNVNANFQTFAVVQQGEA